MKYRYDAARGVEYARAYADYYSVSEDKRLFFYDSNDCTNFLQSMCLGCLWRLIPGFEIPSLKKQTKDH